MTQTRVPPSTDTKPSGSAGRPPADKQPADKHPDPSPPAGKQPPDTTEPDEQGGGGEQLRSSATGWFSDVNGGLWVAATTVFCVLVGGAAHLMLLAAALGDRANGQINWLLVVPLCIVLPSLAVGLFTLGIALSRKRKATGKRTITAPTWWIAATGSAFMLLVTGLLCTVAWLANTGRQVPSQPIVGASLAVIAFASFGGYFLGSRRARVGLAASFVLTFLMLFTFLLTLDYLNTTVSGQSANGVNVLRDFINDFRGDVTLIVGFYFGTDAAVNIVKIWQSSNSKDPQTTVRADRDIATPRP